MVWNWIFPLAIEQRKENCISSKPIVVEKISEFMKDLDAYIDRYLKLKQSTIENYPMSEEYCNLLTLRDKQPRPFSTLEEFIQSSYLLKDEKIGSIREITRTIYAVVFAKNHPKLRVIKPVKSASEITIEEMLEICAFYKPYISAQSLAGSILGDSFQNVGETELKVPKDESEFEELMKDRIDGAFIELECDELRKGGIDGAFIEHEFEELMKGRIDGAFVELEFDETRKSRIDGAFIEAYFRGSCWKYVNSEVNEALCNAYVNGYGKGKDQEVIDEWTKVMEGYAKSCRRSEAAPCVSSK
ncbi:MAG: hypothetical protein H7A40_01915 [Chlamydiales bacterium]|nr:hypothetical protein [Chlamydiales bacterium]